MDSKQRLNFGKLSEVIDPPNLIQNQVDSFHDFLQRDIPATHRKQAGLEAVFKEVFPILSYDEKSRLEYVSYSIGESKLSEMDCIDQNCTFAPVLPLFGVRKPVLQGSRWLGRPHARSLPSRYREEA